MGTAVSLDVRGGRPRAAGDRGRASPGCTTSTRRFSTYRPRRARSALDRGELPYAEATDRPALDHRPLRARCARDRRLLRRLRDRGVRSLGARQGLGGRSAPPTGCAPTACARLLRRRAGGDVVARGGRARAPVAGRHPAPARPARDRGRRRGARRPRGRDVRRLRARRAHRRPGHRPAARGRPVGDRRRAGPRDRRRLRDRRLRDGRRRPGRGRSGSTATRR